MERYGPCRGMYIPKTVCQNIDFVCEESGALEHTAKYLVEIWRGKTCPMQVHDVVEPVNLFRACQFEIEVSNLLVIFHFISPASSPLCIFGEQ